MKQVESFFVWWLEVDWNSGKWVEWVKVSWSGLKLVEVGKFGFANEKNMALKVSIQGVWTQSAKFVMYIVTLILWEITCTDSNWLKIHVFLSGKFQIIFAYS